MKCICQVLSWRRKEQFYSLDLRYFIYHMGRCFKFGHKYTKMFDCKSIKKLFIKASSLCVFFPDVVAELFKAALDEIKMYIHYISDL